MTLSLADIFSGNLDLLDWAVMIGFGAMSLALIMTLIRLLLGPSLPDRVAALDLLAFIAVAFIALYCVATQQEIFLDAAVALALIAFLSTLAFARLIERQTRDKERAEPSPQEEGTL